MFIRIFGCGLSSPSYIFALDIMHLYVIEFIYGISFAFQRPALFTLMAIISDKPYRGLILGIFDSFDDLSGALAALLSGIAVSSLGFELLFFCVSPVTYYRVFSF